MTEKKKMPDFDSLSDRMIAEPTHEPIFAIKTNLDSNKPSKDNPYYTKEPNSGNKDELDDYFRNS